MTETPAPKRVLPVPATRTGHQLPQDNEAEMIAAARAEVAAGKLVDAAEVDAWIASLDTDQELPPPRSGR